jgi:hypothetical protein
VRFFSFFHSSFLFFGGSDFPDCQKSSAFDIFSSSFRLWCVDAPEAAIFGFGGGRHESPLLQLFALFLGGSKVI